MTKPTVWKELLDALLEERADLDRIIEWVERRAQLGSVRDQIRNASGRANGSAVRTTTTTTSSGPYANMSVTEAAKAYLASAKGPKSTREICDALEAGGYVSQSQNFAATVYGTLARSPDLKRVRKKWKLSPAAAEGA